MSITPEQMAAEEKLKKEQAEKLAADQKAAVDNKAARDAKAVLNAKIPTEQPLQFETGLQKTPTPRIKQTAEARDKPLDAKKNIDQEKKPDEVKGDKPSWNFFVHMSTLLLDLAAPALREKEANIKKWLDKWLGAPLRALIKGSEGQTDPQGSNAQTMQEPTLTTPNDEGPILTSGRLEDAAASLTGLQQNSSPSNDGRQITPGADIKAAADRLARVSVTPTMSQTAASAAAPTDNDSTHNRPTTRPGHS